MVCKKTPPSSRCLCLCRKFHLAVEVGGLLHSYTLQTKPKLIMMKHHRNR